MTKREKERKTARVIFEKDSLPAIAGFEDGRVKRQKDYRQLSETGKSKKTESLLIFQKETHSSQYIDNSRGDPVLTSDHQIYKNKSLLFKLLHY